LYAFPAAFLLAHMGVLAIPPLLVFIVYTILRSCVVKFFVVLFYSPFARYIYFPLRKVLVGKYFAAREIFVMVFDPLVYEGQY